MRVAPDLMPLSLTKQPDWTNPTGWITGSLAVTAAGIVCWRGGPRVGRSSAVSDP